MDQIRPRRRRRPSPRRGAVGTRPGGPAEGLRAGRRGRVRPAVRRDRPPRVFGLAVRVVRDPAQAEEVTQEAFLEIWRTSGRFDPAKGSPLAWLLTIVHRKAVDRVRSAEASTRRDTTYHQQQPAGRARLDRRGRHGLARGAPGPPGAGRPHRGAARGPRAGVLRRLHTHGGGDHARATGRHRQDPHPRRTDPTARHHGGGRHDATSTLCPAPTPSTRSTTSSAPSSSGTSPSAPACRAEVDPPARGRRAARRDHRHRRRPPSCATGCSPTSPTVRPLPPPEADRHRPLEPAPAPARPPVSRGRRGGRRARHRRDRLAAGERRRPDRAASSQVLEAAATPQRFTDARRRRRQRHRRTAPRRSTRRCIVTEDMPAAPDGHGLRALAPARRRDGAGRPDARRRRQRGRCSAATPPRPTAPASPSSPRASSPPSPATTSSPCSPSTPRTPR